MDTSLNPKKGFNVALMVSIIALGVGGAALYLALTNDPLESKRGTNAFKGALDRYKEDLKTAGGTAKAELEMEVNRDFRAAIEYRAVFNDKQQKEKFSTFEVKEEEDYKREAPKDAKDAKPKKNKGSGEYKVLFVTFKEDDEVKKEVIVMEKFLLPTDEEGKTTDMWKRASGMSSVEIGQSNKKLGDKMDSWK